MSKYILLCLLMLAGLFGGLLEVNCVPHLGYTSQSASIPLELGFTDETQRDTIMNIHLDVSFSPKTGLRVNDVPIEAAEKSLPIDIMANVREVGQSEKALLKELAYNDSQAKVTFSVDLVSKASDDSPIVASYIIRQFLVSVNGVELIEKESQYVLMELQSDGSISWAIMSEPEVFVSRNTSLLPQKFTKGSKVVYYSLVPVAVGSMLIGILGVKKLRKRTKRRVSNKCEYTRLAEECFKEPDGEDYRALVVLRETPKSPTAPNDKILLIKDCN